MDVIINIIIVIVVISSILKRFQEVGKKSGEVTRPSPPLRERLNVPPLPHVTGDATPEPAMEPVSHEATNEPEVRSLKDLVDYLKEEYQQAATPAPQLESPVAAFEPESADIESTLSAAPAVAWMGRRVQQQPYRAVSPSLTFSREQVLNGIILSEVLGPPVALRNSAGPGMNW